MSRAAIGRWRWPAACSGLPRCPSTTSSGCRPARLRVTLECAGNGRGVMTPRYPSMPWGHEAVGTAEWTGTPLRHVLERVGLGEDAAEIAFIGADRGFDSGQEHAYGRSLKREPALGDDVLLVWAMNGAPLLPQHGFPLRLIVPGWYGMASVKWLDRIEALDKPYDGYQQAVGYHYPLRAGRPAHARHAHAGEVAAGAARHPRLVHAPPAGGRRRGDADGPRVVGSAACRSPRSRSAIDGAWQPAELDPPQGKFAWRGWRASWNATPGEHELACRATDANGETQPLETPLGCRRLRQQCRAPRARDGEIATTMSTIEVSLWRGKADGGYQHLRGAAARQPDRARHRHLGAAQRRPHARLPLRLPRRHVRRRAP